MLFRSVSAGARNIGAGHGAEPTSVATLERRLSGICWHYRQLGDPLDSRDRHISTVLAGIRRQHGRPPVQKEAIFADELLAMINVLDMDLRGLRDRTILAISFAGGLRQVLRCVCTDGQPSSFFAERAKSIGLPAGITAQRVIAVRAARVEPVRSLLITALGAGR